MQFSVNCSTTITPIVDYAILREATSETYGPGVYSPLYYFLVNLPISDAIYFAIFTFNLYHKNTKNIYLIIIISIRSHSFASGPEGIDNPFITLVARFLFVCVGTRDLCVASYWVDTLVLKN